MAETIERQACIECAIGSSRSSRRGKTIFPGVAARCPDLFRPESLKGECIRPGRPLSLDDARRLVQGYGDHYNNVRLNSATGYITPKEMLAGRQQDIHAERDRKLEAARKQRQIRRQQAA